MHVGLQLYITYELGLRRLRRHIVTAIIMSHFLRRSGSVVDVACRVVQYSSEWRVTVTDQYDTEHLQAFSTKSRRRLLAPLFDLRYNNRTSRTAIVHTSLIARVKSVAGLFT